MKKNMLLKPGEKPVRGRKRAVINWDEVSKFIMAGSNGMQIAAYIGICEDTLYSRCREDNKKDFSLFLTEQRQKGNTYLLGKQYQVAMGGNVSMLIWLGKQRLGQTDQPRDKEEFNGSLSNLLGMMHMIKSSGDFSALVKLARKDTSEEELKEDVTERD